MTPGKGGDMSEDLFEERVAAKDLGRDPLGYLNTRMNSHHRDTEDTEGHRGTFGRNQNQE